MECKGENEGKNKGEVGSIFIWEEKKHKSVRRLSGLARSSFRYYCYKSENTGFILVTVMAGNTGRCVLISGKFRTIIWLTLKQGR